MPFIARVIIAAIITMLNAGLPLFIMEEYPGVRVPLLLDLVWAGVLLVNFSAIVTTYKSAK